MTQQGAKKNNPKTVESGRTYKVRTMPIKKM